MKITRVTPHLVDPGYGKNWLFVKVETAETLWDLAGKRAGLPVVELLGGPCRERMRVYANGWCSGAMTPHDYAARAKATVARGFTALKFDPFPGPWRTHISREAERAVVATVGAVREAVGPDVDLLIEVHPRLAPMHAVRVARLLERAPGLGIDLREDVLARFAYREFPARPVPVPGDEAP